MKGNRDRVIAAVDVPGASALDPESVRSAWYLDSYRAPVRHAELDPAATFLAIFAHAPMWAKVMLILRNWLARRVGLKGPPASEVLNTEIRDRYEVGDQIGRWPILYLSPSEIIAGVDDRHLDFRVSVLRETVQDDPAVVVSTVCNVHGWFGKAYLFFVVPFHRLGMKMLLSRAVAAGRL